MNWIDILRDLLCKIYQVWGGDCGTIGPLALEWIDTIREVFETEGVGGISQEDLADALNTLETHLALPENSLSPEDAESLAVLIAQIREALGGT